MRKRRTNLQSPNMKKKSTENNRHAVAWISKAEWDQVLEYLYSKDCELQKFALHRMSSWKCRYANYAPIAIESTAELVRCQVLDKSGQLDGDDLVLLYGTALVRFTNLITERQQGRCARPLRQLAGELRIPEWVVDLRHDITHRSLPTLTWCRKGCKVVLEWLQQEYWSRQLGSGLNENWDSQSDREDDEDELQCQEELLSRQKDIDCYRGARRLLISYEKEQFQTFEIISSEDKRKSFWPAPSADIRWVLGQVKQFALESSEALIDVLIEDGFLVPTVDQLVSLDCNISDDVNPSDPLLPRVFLHFWMPLLKGLNSPVIIHLLLEKLFVELQHLSEEPNSHRSFFIAAWIREVIICNTKKTSRVQRKSNLKELIFVNRIQLRWQQLLSACLAAPCVSTPYLLQLILGDMEHSLPFDIQQNLLRLCSIYTHKTQSECDLSLEHGVQPVYTVENLYERILYSANKTRPRRLGADLKKKLSERPAEVGGLQGADILSETGVLVRGSPWQVCKDKVQWKSYPLGKVPGQAEDPSCLMMDKYCTMTVFDQQMEMESSMQQNVNVGVTIPLGTSTDGPLWTVSDMNKIKSGLLLF